MNSHDHLASHFVGGESVTGPAGLAVESVDPFDGRVHWRGTAADSAMVDSAVSSARRAAPKWASMPQENRTEIIRRFTEIVKERSDSLAELISRECGKPLWDARVEVNSLITKFDATRQAYVERVAEAHREVRGLTSRTRFLPHGVMAVLGPFNFPMSMANSHIMPALFAGNAVVFKPSELTPLCGLAIAGIWQDAGLPPGVMNCLSGGRETGQMLVAHDQVDGVLFIGSHSAGLAILRSLADHPEKIVAVEMGGNSPLIVWDYDDLDVAAHIVVQSSMVTSGQRCSSARRLIVRADDTQILPRLVEMARRIRIGRFSEQPEPFYGPLIRPAAAERVLQRATELVSDGGELLLTPLIGGPNRTMVTPGIIDVTACSSQVDEEIFGPFLKVVRVDSFERALEEANNTKFGLAAGVICKERELFDRFFRETRAGIVNWNQQLTGATTFAPFGGVKQSGNYRPAGYLSSDYCSYSVASFEVERPKMPEALSPGLMFDVPR